jgi:hypothetical protein
MVNNLKQTILAEIEQNGIDAVQEKYLAQSMDRYARQLAREIFGNLEQNTITGEWGFKKK